ncbi:hypothetical protein J2W54_000277 [Rhodococcus fascians]|nr:hypothetical protein [Rhodococcus sp. 3258]MDR6929911.1 hypothetical protein [Rhodococcus fascians]
MRLARHSCSGRTRKFQSREKSIHSMWISQPNNGWQRQLESQPEASEPAQVLCWRCAKTPSARTGAGANGNMNRHGLTETNVAIANKPPTLMRTLPENRQGDRAQRHHGLKSVHQQSTRVRSERENRDAQHDRQGTVPKLRLVGRFRRREVCGTLAQRRSRPAYKPNASFTTNLTENFRTRAEPGADDSTRSRATL